MLPGMTLAEFLASKPMTEAAFAELIGVSQPTVHRYITRKRFPDRDTILRIEAVTEGTVRPADWYAPEAPVEKADAA
jgi:predicted transcriptional regulator